MVRKVNFEIVVLLLCFIVLGIACTQKALPVITSRTTEPIKKEKKSADIQPDLVAGRTIFENRCKKCHDLPLVNQFTSQRWDGILSYMMPRARLNNEQSVHVSAYLKENSAK